MLVLVYLILVPVLCGRHNSEASSVSTLVKAYTDIRQVFGCNVTLCSDTETYAPSPPVNPNQTCCSECSCDSSCERNGDCCPDMLRKFPHPDQYPPGGVYDCISRRQKDRLWTTTGAWVVSKCDLKYLDMATARRCTFSKEYNETWNKDIESYVPVVDTSTNETFRNYFCAKCNFVPDDNIVQWNVAIECTNDAMFIPRTLATLFEDSKGVTNCDVVYAPPSGFPQTPYCRSLISRCNDTGKSLPYDKFMVDACSAFRANFSFIYANVFCYICNAEVVIADEMTCRDSTGSDGWIDGWIPSFSLLLDFRKSPKEADFGSVCFEGFEYDHYKDECREVVCPDRTVYDDGTCRSLFRNTPEGICYEMFIKISLMDRNISPSSSDFKTALTTFSQKLFDREDIESQYDVHVSMVTEDNLLAEPANGIYYILHVQLSGIGSIQLTKELIQLDNTKAGLLVHGSETVYVFLQISSYEVDTDFRNDQITEHVIRQSWDNDSDRLPLITSGIVPVLCTTSRLLVTKVSVCPLFVLNNSDFIFQKRKTGIYIVNFGVLAQPGSFKYDDSTGQLAVCMSDYIQWIKKSLTSTDGVSEVITLVCSSLSISCLVVVILTYCIFPVLRTRPGLNNMSLSLCLLLAQTLFILGVRRSELGALCGVIGGIIHFLFLAVMFWMSICSVHMFRVFRSMNSPKQIGPVLKSTALYTTAVLVLSAVCVAVNITVTYIRSSGSEYGYGVGNSICYISSAIMIGYTITLPAGLVVALNTVLLVSVVVKINKMSVIQSSTLQNRGYFFIYIRLSTITGIAWLSVIPYILTNSKVFEYISVALTSSQGVFIFAAFIVNRRIFNLYREMLGMKLDAALSSSKPRTTQIIESRT